MSENVSKRWLNLEIYKSEEMPSKFEKIRRISEIRHPMRPQIGKYCWDVTVNKGNEDAEEPEEMIHSRVEIQEESLLKVTGGLIRCILKMMPKVSKKKNTLPNHYKQR